MTTEQQTDLARCLAEQREALAHMGSLRFGSLFTGIGGIDLGLERAGHRCAWQVEIDPLCNQALEKHWPGVKRYGDIRELRGDELEPVDLLAGGYPCQPFSQAGKRGGDTDPRHLWPEFARLIRVLRPRFVLLENVPGHLSLGFGAVLGDLAGLGYDAEWLCLRAADFGAAHLRKRVFVVAYRNAGRDGQDGEVCTGRNAAEYAGGSLADSTERGFRIVRESSGRVGLAHGGFPQLDYTQGEDGRGELEASGAGRRRDGFARAKRELAHPARDVRDGSHGQDGTRRGVCEAGEPVADAGDGQLSQPWRRSEGRDGIGSAGAVLSDASAAGLPHSEPGELPGAERNKEGRTTSELCGAFAPGPSDPRWPGILTSRPDLAPSLESPLRRMADGLPDWLDRAMSERTKRLRALGNSVVPQVAKYIGRALSAHMAVAHGPRGCG